MKFSDVPLGSVFTATLTKLSNSPYYPLNPNAEVELVHVPLKPYTRIQYTYSGITGQYLKNKWVWWDHMNQPTTLSYAATTEHYTPC